MVQWIFEQYQMSQREVKHRLVGMHCSTLLGCQYCFSCCEKFPNEHELTSSQARRGTPRQTPALGTQCTYQYTLQPSACLKFGPGNSAHHMYLRQKGKQLPGPRHILLVTNLTCQSDVNCSQRTGTRSEHKHARDQNTSITVEIAAARSPL